MLFKWIADEMFMLRSLPKVSSFSSNIQLQFKEKYLTTISIPMDSKSLKDLRLSFIRLLLVLFRSFYATEWPITANQ